MDTFINLLHHRPVVFLHLVTALGALIVGAIQLLRSRQGDARHRVWGWAWVLLMGTAAVSSAFIRDYRMPNIGGFGPIHLLTAFVTVQLPLAVYFAKTGNIVAHKKTMKGLYVGGCIVAGIFTLLPGRFLGQMLWKHALAL
jgi:uncharacterized membrane protein